MANADTRANEPKNVQLQAGTTYYWCRCGKSKAQPFCDGSHVGGSQSPLSFVAEKTGTAYLCVCKKSGNAPYCDGSHKQAASP